MSNIYLDTNRLRWSGDTQRRTKVSRPPIDTLRFRPEIRCWIDSYSVLSKNKQGVTGGISGFCQNSEHKIKLVSGCAENSGHFILGVSVSKVVSPAKNRVER